MSLIGPWIETIDQGLLVLQLTDSAIEVGLASTTFITTGNATILIATAPEFRGQVTALWSAAFLGSTPGGATIIGYVNAYSPRPALLLEGMACGIAAIMAFT